MTAAWHELSLLEVSALLAARRLSPVELTRAMLERVAALDPILHAYSVILPERAMQSARRAEAELAAGENRGRLHGVPIAVKDLCDVRGVPTTAGTRVLRANVANDDACVVARLEAAGAILLGKLAMTEGAFVTHRPEVPPPVNPWDASAWTGISSSGSGVATAAGLCFGALGTDTGGSIRYPSACNGLVGLKPTYGRVPRHGVFPMCDSLDHVGPMARTAADAAALFDVIAGRDPRDPTSLEAPVERSLDGVDRDLHGVRVGIDARYSFAAADPAIARAVGAVADVLAAAGAELKEVRVPDVSPAMAAWEAIAPPELALAYEASFPGHEAEFGPALRAMIESGREMPATLYARASQVRTAFRAELARFFGHIDLLLCPALSIQLRADTDLLAPPVSLGSRAMIFTLPFNVTGSPTITFPCGFRGVAPIGAQLVARDLEEPLLLRAVHAYQQRTDWHRRRPDL